MNNHLDLLSQFGGDINAAVAAAAALQSVGSGQNQQDPFAAVANLNALAQLNQLATANPKVAAMLQLQQQLGAMSQQTNHHPSSSNSHYQGTSNNHQAYQSSVNVKPGHTRYQQLLSIIDEMGKDLRTTYLQNKNSTERLKRGIASARILVKDCQLECERNTKQ